MELIFEYLVLKDKMNLLESGLIDYSLCSVIFDEIKKPKEYYLIHHNRFDGHNGRYVVNTCILYGDNVVHSYITEMHDDWHDGNDDFISGSTIIKYCNKCVDERIVECKSCVYIYNLLCDVGDCRCDVCHYIDNIQCNVDPNVLICDDCTFCGYCSECDVYLKISAKLDFEFIYKKCKNRVCCSNCKTKMRNINCLSDANIDISTFMSNTNFDTNTILYDDYYNI
jgi:hypothetical protein